MSQHNRDCGPGCSPLTRRCLHIPGINLGRENFLDGRVSIVGCCRSCHFPNLRSHLRRNYDMSECNIQGVMLEIHRIGCRGVSLTESNLRMESAVALNSDRLRCRLHDLDAAIVCGQGICSIIPRAAEGCRKVSVFPHYRSLTCCGDNKKYKAEDSHAAELEIIVP